MVAMKTRQFTDGSGHALARDPPHIPRRRPSLGQDCCAKSSVRSEYRDGRGILLTVQRGGRSVPAGAQKDFAMFETVTAFLGLISVGIFAAHALEGFRSRA